MKIDSDLPKFPDADYYTCIEDAERMHSTTPHDAIVEYFDDCGPEQVEFGVTVYAYAKLTPPHIGGSNIVDEWLELLEEGSLVEHVDPEGAFGACWDTDACKALRPQLEELAQKMVDGMRVWSCRSVGSVELTAEQVEAVLRERAPEFFQEKKR